MQRAICSKFILSINFTFWLLGTFFNLVFAQKPSLIVNKGFNTAITKLHFSIDGKVLYSTGKYPNKSIDCWDIASGKLLHSFEGTFDEPILHFSPQEKEIVVFTDNQMANLMEIKIWDLATYQLKSQTIRTKSFLESPILEVPFYSNGDTLYRVDNPVFAKPMPFRTIKNSPSGKILAGYTYQRDKEQTIVILDTKTFTSKQTFYLDKQDVRLMAFSLDEQYLICLQDNMQVSFWELKTGKKIASKIYPEISDLGVIIDNLYLANNRAIFSNYDKKAVFVNLNTQQLWHIPDTLLYHNSDLSKVAVGQAKNWSLWDTQTQKPFLQDSLGKQIATAFDMTSTGEIAVGTQEGNIFFGEKNSKTFQNLGTPVLAILQVLPKENDKFLIRTSTAILLWDKNEGRMQEIVDKPDKDDFIINFIYDNLENQLLIQYNNKGLKCINLENKKVNWQYKANEQRFLICNTSDRKHFWMLDNDKLKKLDFKTFQVQQTIPLKDEYNNLLMGIQESPDGKYLMILGNTVATPLINAIDLKTEQSIYNFGSLAGLVSAIDFSITKNVLVAGGSNNVVGIDASPLFALNLQTGKLLREFKGHQDEILAITTHPTEQDIFVSASGDNTLKVWNIEQSKPIHTFNGHQAKVVSAFFIEKGRFLVSASEDGSLILWDWQKKVQILSLFLLDEAGNYLIINPEGRFDGTSEGINKLVHFAVDKEIINIEQLKDRYYEPNLWKKLLGYSQEPLRQVLGLDNIELYPIIELGNFNPQKMILEVNLYPRNGGIGKASLYINGKEVYEDLTKITKSQTIKSKTKISYLLDLKDNDLIISGVENTLEVKAYNAANWLISRGKKLVFKAPLRNRGGSEYNKSQTNSNENNFEDYGEPARFYALCIGVSEYKNPNLNLKLSAKDAEDISNALEISAKRLFEIETKGLTQIYKLTSKQTDLSKKPSRKNILATFEEIIKKVRHQDVVVVYLAGHGVNYGGQDGDFYFLTADALSMKLDDPAIRNEGTISSHEITDFFKKIKAKKQVLIMDACHSGRAIDNLITKRDIESTTIRALDKMKDRTGLHIISGCAADAVSYEASQFDQGILTYSLLSGIQGKALNDKQLIDVNLLFQYAREEVPELAKGIGGIQEPKIFSPYGSETFFLGLLTDTEKKQIKLPMPKPTFVPCKFAEQNEMIDVLNLENLVNESLGEIASRGSAPYLYVSSSELINAYKIVGFYEIQGNLIKFRGALRKNGQKEAVAKFNLEGEKNDMESLKDAILQEVKKQLP